MIYLSYNKQSNNQIKMDYVGYYLMVGLLYSFINGAIRKLDTDGDWFLPLVWIIAWPFGLLALITKGIIKLFKKK